MRYYYLGHDMVLQLIAFGWVGFTVLFAWLAPWSRSRR